MKDFLKGLKPAYGWLLLTTILLVLPGSAFPKETWLSKIYFDKWVHIGLFAIMVWLFCRAKYQHSTTTPDLKAAFLTITILIIGYGIVMEFIQKYFVPYRSFDVGDIIADAAGAFLGYFVSYRLFLKQTS
ncbi:MAG: VanZ family protein [Niabella sp.]